MRERWRQEIGGLLSLAVFVLAVALLFQSVEVAFIITAALGIHELGHVLAISLFGVDWEIGFGVVGAWTSTPASERRALTHFSNGIIHLAGPTFNLVYVVVALLVDRFLETDHDYWLRLANLSATVSLLNSLPIGRISDGGKVIERTFSSLDEKAERWLLPAPVLWLLSLVLLVLVTPSNWLGILAFALVGFWFVVGMLDESLRDKPEQAPPAGAMTLNQGFLLLSWIIILLFASTATVLRTPIWLSRDHVLNMVAGLARNVARPLFLWLQEWIKTIRRSLFAA